MDDESIRAKINKYNCQITKNINEANRLSNKINEFVQMRKKFNETSEKLYNYQTGKRNCFEKLKYELQNTRFVVQSCDEMLGFIDGNEAKIASNSVDNCIARVDDEINNIRERIDELKRENRLLNSRVNDLREQLRRNMEMR